MPEQIEYFDKYLEARFQHIDEAVSRIETGINNTILRVEKKIEDENKATRADNKTTRKWLATTAISLLVGFTAIAIAIFFGFSKLQTSWIQTVISFVGKTVLK